MPFDLFVDAVTVPAEVMSSSIDTCHLGHETSFLDTSETMTAGTIVHSEHGHETNFAEDAAYGGSPSDAKSMVIAAKGALSLGIFSVLTSIGMLLSNWSSYKTELIHEEVLDRRMDAHLAALSAKKNEL